MPDLVFGEYPVNLGGEGQRILLERESAGASVRAFRCRTWGEFAEIAKLEWSELYDEWGEDYAESGKHRRVLRPSTRFRYTHIFFGLTSGPELSHPARVAYEIVHRSAYIRDYIVSRHLEFEPGTPMGHIECVLAESRDPFLELKEYLSRERRHHWTLEEDDRLVRCALRGGR